MKRFALAVAIALLVGPFARAEDVKPDLGKTSGERLMDEAMKKLRARFYDREKRSKIDWDGLAQRYREELRASASAHDAHVVVNRALGELKTSHLALIEGSVYSRELESEFAAKKTVRAGCELELIDGKMFVGSAYGPAEQAGLLPGDEVLEIDHVESTSSTRLEEAGHDPGLPGLPGFVLGVKKGERIAMLVRSDRDGPVREVALVPDETSMLEAARASVRVDEARGKKIGRIHLWHFMTTRMASLLEQSLDGPLHDADALLLDVRGRGGQAIVIQRVLANFRADHPRWRKPVTALIDGETRSAKEIFAWAFHRDHLGKLVGERTKGAVIGCQFEKLFDGSVLMLPVSDVRGMTQGEQLEGAGVEPDVQVEQGALPFRHGRDRIAERGIEVTLERLAERASHRYR